MLAVVFAFTTLSTPVRALGSDDLRYGGGGTYEEGDDSGWSDPGFGPIEPDVHMGVTQAQRTGRILDLDWGDSVLRGKRATLTPDLTALSAITRL